MIVKKYGNRRLYDTEASRYVTQEELTQKIRDGAEVRVVDAKSGEDLTQATLTQIIVEGRGADTLFPAPLLHQLIRLGDDALADFLGRYVSVALELYLQARNGAQTLGAFSFNPFAPVTQLVSQFMSSPPPAATTDVEQLRKEVDQLKKSLRRKKK